MKLGKVIISFIMTVAVMGMSAANAFTDINSEHWAYEKVKLMQEKEIISGFEDGTFRPDTSVTREQFASILVKTLGVTNIYSDIEFEDVEGHRWSKDAIKIASPYLTGYQIDSKYYFRPSEPAVREDMAVAVVKAKGLENQEPNYAVLDKFSDKDKISEGVKKYVAIAIENEIMNGNANGTFNPLGSLTRAEITALMYNVMEKVAINDVVKEELKEIEVKSISLNDTYVELEVGETLKLKPIIKPDDAENKEVTWSSGNSDVASVDSTGKVTARHPGDTNIYVKLKANSELNTKCRITVIDKEKEEEKAEDEDNTADDEYSVKLTSNTGSVLTDESIITAKISASENIKYAKLEIIYSPNSDWAGNGKKISESEVKEIKNGKVKFDFAECVDGVVEELTEDTMGLIVVLSSSKKFDAQTKAKTFYGYSYRESLPEFEITVPNNSSRHGTLILGEDYDKYEFKYGRNKKDMDKTKKWYKAMTDILTLDGRGGSTGLTSQIDMEASYVCIRYIGDSASEKVVQIRHEIPDFEVDHDSRSIYLDKNRYGYTINYSMADGSTKIGQAQYTTDKIDLYEQFKFISENKDCESIEIRIWRESDSSKLNSSYPQSIVIDINDVLDAMDFGISNDTNSWKGNTLYLTETIVVYAKGAYEGGSLKYALVYDGEDYTYGGFNFIKNPKQREETNMSVKSLVNQFKNMNDIDLREKEITIEMYYDNGSDYSWRDYSKSFTFKIHEHREDYEKFVNNKDGATHTKEIYCEPCDMLIKETGENHDFINFGCACGARLQAMMFADGAIGEYEVGDEIEFSVHGNYGKKTLNYTIKDTETGEILLEETETIISEDENIIIEVTEEMAGKSLVLINKFEDDREFKNDGKVIRGQRLEKEYEFLVKEIE